MTSRTLRAAPTRPEPTEKQWMATVVQAARLLGYCVYHTHRSDHSEPGFPDLFMAKPAERIGEPSTILVAELKTERGRLSPAQARWLDLFASAGVPAFIWRPSDWPTVEAVLKGEET